MLQQGRWSSAPRYVPHDRPYEAMVPVTTEHLRAAVLDGGCQRDVVPVLLGASGATIDSNDKVIWDWIHRRKAEGNADGEWLEERIKHRMGMFGRDAKALDRG